MPTINSYQQQTTACRGEIPYLRERKLAHPGTADSSFAISMLIGGDLYRDLVEDHLVTGNGPTAVKSQNQAHNPRATKHHIFKIMASNLPTNALERFGSLESMGISQASDNTEFTDYFKEYQQSS